jgi:UDP-N-acetylmuramoyl-tripeptide--D-alanyl-D-alanine ligase
VRPRSLAEIAAATRGVVVGDDDARIAAVCTDSRTTIAGSLFVAIEGERTDGHRFIDDAFARGAAAALAGAGRTDRTPRVEVSSTSEALLALAADERRAFGGTVVAVTGANGKTSTKDLTAAVLSARFRVHASPASFNNEIGLPATLLGAPEDAEVIVVELGARREGDVALLMGIAEPSVVVVTNVGLAHIGVFGSWETIVRASAEPVAALGGDGVAILNADDPVVAGYRSAGGARVVTFGVGAGSDVRAQAVTVGSDGRATFDLVAGGGRERVTLAVPGEHMVANALAAAAVGIELDVPLDACAAALGRASVSRWRMESFEGRAGIRVLNDAYNANPESVAAALKTAKVMAGEARVIAVLGRMAELGNVAEREHERIGELAARLRIDRLITVGTEAKTIAVAGVREGVEPDAVASYDDVDTALADVLGHTRPGDLVLIKGSRVVGLETLAEALR